MMTLLRINANGLWDLAATRLRLVWPLQYCAYRRIAMSENGGYDTVGPLFARLVRTPSPAHMSARTRLKATALLGAFITSLGCMRATANAEGAALTSTAIAPPKLVVFITVDQLRGDMLD